MKKPILYLLGLMSSKIKGEAPSEIEKLRYENQTLKTENDLLQEALLQCADNREDVTFSIPLSDRFLDNLKQQPVGEVTEGVLLDMSGVQEYKSKSSNEPQWVQKIRENEN